MSINKLWSDEQEAELNKTQMDNNRDIDKELDKE